jgi:pimeloyl-ACP methyl ester carboxylesterase
VSQIMTVSAQPAERHFLGLSPAGFHRNAYWEWTSAKADAPTLMAVHGLTRNGRDFDAIARNLASDFRVVCPDVVGRGHSAWLPQGALYSYPQYLADCGALIARLGVDRVDWLGTSMGGLMGMMLAAVPGSPIRRLILNDVAPFIPKAALERIATYAGDAPRFATTAELELYMRKVYATFGRLTDENWAHLARYNTRALPDGGFTLAYDPAIGDAFKAAPIVDVDLWPLWDGIQCPVLILRGRESDLVSAETAAEMVRRKPAATLVTFDDCGHAPALMADEQILAIRHWLQTTPAE